METFITFGLNSKQNEFISANFPTPNCQLYNTDCVTDIIAIPSTATIIAPATINKNDLEMIIEYYIGTTGETVFWIGTPNPPTLLNNKLKYYENFEMFAANLKYLLLTAHTKHKKIKAFSKKLADSLIILSLIRKNPGIKTQELANRTEMSARSVQRYISTLQATGEWIDYDTSKRGWILFDGVSILFGDHLSD